MAAELYTEPVTKIWRGFQEATRSRDCGVACLSTDRCEFLHKQQSIGERENPETQPQFSERFCHIRRQPNHHTHKKKAGPDILLSCHFSYLPSSFYLLFIFYFQNLDSFSFSSRYLHSLACTNSGTSNIFSGLSFPSIICTYS